MYRQHCIVWGGFGKARRTSDGAGLGHVRKMVYRQPWLYMFGIIHYVEAGAKDEEICCGETDEIWLYIVMEHLLGYNI